LEEGKKKPLKKRPLQKGRKKTKKHGEVRERRNRKKNIRGGGGF